MPRADRFSAERIRLAGYVAAPLLHRCCTTRARRRFRNGFKFEIGSGAGIRTLNLAVNSRLLYR